MRRSVLFARVFGVVIFTIAITAVFTTVVYTYVARSVFTQIKEDELLPRARALGDLLITYQGRLESNDLLDALSEAVGLNDEGDLLLGAYVVATDNQGNVILHSNRMDGEYLSVMTKAASDVLEVGEVRTDQIKALRGSSLVCVGAPVYGDGAVLGAVLLLVPLYEAMVAMGSLNSALALSLLLSLPFVAAMVYYVVGRIVMPLRQMRDVAVGMAGGNFEARADDSQRGEVGQLGRSLNYLSCELSRTISALTLERNRLQRTFDGLREGIVAVDAQGHVTHRNPAVTNLFKPLRREDTSEEHLRLIPDESVWKDFGTVVTSGETTRRILDVGDRKIALSIVPLSGEEQIAGAVGLFTDVTESERLERTRRDYVANVSHEMRTPLTAMRALLEPLSEGMVADEQTRGRYYNIMLRETMRLSRLIDDLMELSRLQSGTIRIEPQKLNLAQLLGEIAGKYDPIAEDHGLNFEVKVDGDCPPVLANPDRLEQILVILLDNAMKYTPEGGSVFVEAAFDKYEVTLCVRDTGIGIAPEDQPYVFDRFYKVDKAHSGLGSGLGLSIASELAQQMGERIWLTSFPGHGSSFCFTVKRA